MNPEKSFSFMGDTQLGGDKEQTRRKTETDQLVEEYLKINPAGVDEAWHVGDLGTSATVYEFLADYKKIGKRLIEKKENESPLLREEIYRELNEAFQVVVKTGQEKADKYAIAKTLRKTKVYPEVEAVLTKFAQDERIKQDPQLKQAITNNDTEAKLDLYKAITGKNIDFLAVDEASMIEEMHGALNTMSKLTTWSGKLGVVSGNQEIDNMKRVTEKMLPQFQRDVDFNREPSYHEVTDQVAIMGLPYQYDAKKFNPQEYAAQADGKKTVILAMHASPLLRGLADNINPEKYQPQTLEEYQQKIMKDLGVNETQMDQPFSQIETSLKSIISVPRLFKNKPLKEIIAKMAQSEQQRAQISYDNIKSWTAERKRRQETLGKAERTPGSQKNPMDKEFRQIIKNLPDSVKKIYVPWGHLHSAPEQALSNHPWFKYDQDEEIKPQEITIGMPGTKGAKKINFVYLPTAAVAIFEADKEGNVDVASLKKMVKDNKK